MGNRKRNKILLVYLFNCRHVFFAIKKYYNIILMQFNQSLSRFLNKNEKDPGIINYIYVVKIVISKVEKLRDLSDRVALHSSLVYFFPNFPHA